LTVRDRYSKTIEMSRKREPFGRLGRIFNPLCWTSNDDISKELYEKIGIIVEKQDPDELAVLCAVDRAQFELRRLDPISEMNEEWGLWDVCVVLEDQIGQDMQV